MATSVISAAIVVIMVDKAWRLLAKRRRKRKAKTGDVERMLVNNSRRRAVLDVRIDLAEVHGSGGCGLAVLGISVAGGGMR